jgi:hypothetical protein
MMQKFTYKKLIMPGPFILMAVFALNVQTITAATTIAVNSKADAESQRQSIHIP